MPARVDPHHVRVCDRLQPQKVTFDDFAPPKSPPWVPTHQVGSLPAPQNKKAEADVPKTGVTMRLWNKIPSELPTDFFKPGKFHRPTVGQPQDGTAGQTGRRPDE